jgi:hypothetical protein
MCKSLNPESQALNPKLSLHYLKRSYFIHLTCMVACLGIRCRKGIADVLVNIADLWFEGEPSMEALSDYHLCGKSSPANFWVSSLH